MIAKHFLMQGVVQGVGFRRFVRKRAREVGVLGWVRNLADGRVEALIQGAEEEVTRMETYLQRGPNSGKVETCDSRTVPINTDLRGFEILKNGEAVWEF